MAKARRERRLSRPTLLLWTAIVLFAAGVGLCFYLLAGRQVHYTIVDGGAAFLHSSYEQDPSLVLEEAGLKMEFGDRVESYGEGSERTLKLHRGIRVRLVIDGEVSLVSTSGDTVRDLLQQVGADVRTGDYVSCGLGDRLRDGMSIYITTVRTRYVRFEVPTALPVEYVGNPVRPEGSVTVMVPGKSGLDFVVFRDTYVGGVLTAREEYQRTTVIRPEARVVEIGTALKGEDYLVLADGRVRELPRGED